MTDQDQGQSTPQTPAPTEAPRSTESSALRKRGRQPRGRSRRSMALGRWKYRLARRLPTLPRQHRSLLLPLLPLLPTLRVRRERVLADEFVLRCGKVRTSDLDPRAVQPTVSDARGSVSRFPGPSAASEDSCRHVFSTVVPLGRKNVRAQPPTPAGATSNLDDDVVTVYPDRSTCATHGESLGAVDEAYEVGFGVVPGDDFGAPRPGPAF